MTDISQNIFRSIPAYRVKDHYTRGGLGDVKVKKFLNNVMQEELSPIRAREKNTKTVSVMCMTFKERQRDSKT